jgi:uncharacterized membrane protein YkgB
MIRQTHVLNAAFIVSTLGISLVLIWIGIFKFTPTEAKGIEGLVGGSPFLSWMYKLFSLSTTSRIIGIIEILTGMLLIAGLFNSKISLAGGFAATVIFFITSTFLLSTKGVLAEVDGMWVPSDLGSFLMKDLSALGASLFIVFKSLSEL